VATLEEVAALLDGSEAAGPATDEMIASAERELGAEFPPSYRQFLSKYGAALCRGFELAGVFKVENQDEPPLWSSVVTATKQLRRASGSIPTGYLAISDDGGDYKFFLATDRKNPGAECPVVVLGPGKDGVVVASDFLDFVVRTFQNQLVF